MKDKSVFPDATYRDTVLEPLFEGVKKHYAADMNTINRAHLVMLAEEGILSPVNAAKIAHALVEIESGIDISSLSYSGEYEDYFFLIEAELRNKLGPLGGSLHTARSRNDMDHTLFKMALRRRADELAAQIRGLIEALLAKAECETQSLIVAYTHGQPAQATVFAHYLCGVVEVLLRDLERFETARDGLDACPMGAGAITTTGFPINRERVAELLGFGRISLNSYGCIASVDYITGLYSAMKLVFLHLGRVIQDLQFWSAFEVGQLYVPNSLVQISSIMPQKRNPVPIEHLRHLASTTVGRCDGIVSTMHNTPFTDMNDSEGEVQSAGYAAFESGTRVIALMSSVISQCSINTERVRENMDRACVTITELADTLVRDEGLNFRDAHEIAAETSRAVIAKSQPLGNCYVEFAAAYEKVVGRETGLNQDQFATAVSPEEFVRRRNRPGGPAAPALGAAFSTYREQLENLNHRARARQDQMSNADAVLNAAFNKLLEH